MLGADHAPLEESPLLQCPRHGQEQETRLHRQRLFRANRPPGSWTRTGVLDTTPAQLGSGSSLISTHIGSYPRGRGRSALGGLLPRPGDCEDRKRLRSTILTSQFPVSRWHEQIEDPTLADGILDRRVHNAHRIEMRGDSMRKARGPKPALGLPK